MSLTFNKEKKVVESKYTQVLNGGEISVAYTLKTEDITKGAKSKSTPYADRVGIFRLQGETFYNEESASELRVEESLGGLKFSCKRKNADLSQWGINLPFNFMSKKSGGGWEKQYLFNSPYASSDNRHIYCYLTSPSGKNLMLVVDSEIDGWKMDYSPYVGGHFFLNLKILANFDKAYKQSETKKELIFYLFEVDSFEKGLEKVAKVKGLPVLTYDKSGGKIGDKISLKAIGDCDYIEIEGEKYPYKNGVSYTLEKEGEITLTPYLGGVKGLNATIYCYKDIDDLYKKSVYAVNMADIAVTDGNLCEHQCWVSALLRYMRKYGKDERLEELVLSELAVIMETDEEKAKERQTIFNKPHGRFPAYNVYKSGRVQEQFFGVTILLDAYEYFKDEKYLDYAIKALDTLMIHYQKADGRIETYTEWSDSYDDYTTVCCPIIPIVDMSNYLKTINPKKSEYYKNCASKMAEYLYKRGLNFPTEGGASDESDTEMEDGSISCTALALLYYCAHINRKEEYIQKAKEILDIHESWVIKTPIAPMYTSSLRWWETNWEGDADGPALCCGHAWTIWRAEADYWYYHLTGEQKYFVKSYNGFMSNFAKIDSHGRSYSCYQPDYITGGGFHDDSSEIEFKLAHGYPKQTDSGLTRYVWIRAFSSILNDLQ